MFDTTPFATSIGCEIRGFAASGGENEPGRAARLAIAASRQALAQARLEGDDLEATGLAVGTTMGESCWLEAWSDADVRAGTAPLEDLVRSSPDRIGADVAAELRLGGRTTVLGGACAAGNYALGYALDQLRLGRAERIVAGGTDAFSRVAYMGFARLGALARGTCRPFSADRDGIIIGEGAAFLVLETAESARARGAEVLAELVGVGLSTDAYHIVSPDPTGSGAARATAAALDDAGLEPGDIGWISAHGTGTIANDRAEVAAVQAVFGRTKTPMSSIKALTGHALGASSALEAVASVLALRSQVAPPTWNYTAQDPDCVWDVVPNEPRPFDADAVMSNAYAFGGCNASIVIRLDH